MSAQSTPSTSKTSGGGSRVGSPAGNFAEVGEHSVISKQLSNTVLASHIKGKAMWQEVMKELRESSDDLDFTVQDIPIYFSHRLLTEEAEHLLGSSQIIDCQDKGACMALSKLCELFVLEMTMKAYQFHKEPTNTLTRKDVMETIERTETYDLFLEHLANHTA